MSRPIDEPNPGRGAQPAGTSVRGFEGPWCVDVGPSRGLSLWLCAGHAVAAAAVACTPLPVAGTVVLLALVAGSAGLHLARVGRLWLPQSVVRLEVDARGRGLIRRRDGLEQAGWLQASTVVTGRLALVRLRPDGARLTRSVPLLPDNCASEDFRRLRAGLTWQAGPALRMARPAAD